MEHVSSVSFLGSNASFSNAILMPGLLLSVVLTFCIYVSIFCCPDITRWTGTVRALPTLPPSAHSHTQAGSRGLAAASSGLGS